MKVYMLLPLLHCVQAGVVSALQDTPVATIYGKKCLSSCKRAALGSYYYCNQQGDRNHRWDYCSTSPTLTIYGEKCTDRCRVSRYSYSSCKTETSWDYCSTAYTGESRGASWSLGNLYWLLVIPVIIAVCIGGYKLKKRCQESKLFEQFLNPTPSQRESEGFIPEK